MASKPGDPNAPEDIIELTDIIEHGPGAPKQAAAGDGVDLSFEKELEDLFAEPAGSGKPDASGLPGLDDLDLPEGKPADAKTGDEVDLDGLDALLAEAETAKPGAPAPEPTRSGGDDPALNGRLEALEHQVASLEESFRSDLAEAETRLKAAMPETPPAAASDGGELAGLEARLVALETAPPAGNDGELAARIEEVAAGLEERLAGLEARLAQAPAEDLTALAEQVRDHLAQDHVEPAPTGAVPAAEELAARVEELAARFEERLAALEERLAETTTASGETGPRIEELSNRVEERLNGLEAVLGSLPDVSALPKPESFQEMLAPLASREDLDALGSALRQEIATEIAKAVPAAAAQIIREEIQALVRDME